MRIMEVIAALGLAWAVAYTLTRAVRLVKEWRRK